MTRNRRDVHCVWDVRATLGEGPIWCPTRQAIWFVDIKQQRVHLFEVDTQHSQTWHAPEQIGFLAPISHEQFIVGLQSGLHRFDSVSGTFSRVHDIEATLIDNRLNDGHVDNRGRLWFGSMDNREREQTGALYRRDNDGSVACVDRYFSISNGPCTSPDGRTFYHTDTVNKTIYAYDLTDDGLLINKREFKRFEEGEGYPDGSIVDADSCMWVAMWNGWGLIRLSPRGECIDRITLPCANVTKAAFGGRDLKTLYITTARKGLAEAELVSQPLAGGLFAINLDVAGLTTNKVDSTLF